MMRALIAGVALLAVTTPVVAKAPPKPDFAQRVQRVEDELAIRRILLDYSFTQDAHDYEGYTALFAKEGEWANGPTVKKGRDAIHKMLIDLYGATPAGYVNNESYHITTNLQVDIDGDRATARSRHLLIMRGPSGQPEPVLAGRYEDQLIREDGAWKILKRIDYPIMPTPEEWGKYIRERRAQQK
ncbi:nuclear transport factor 2 family protein [Sphingobium sp. H33]|uniref:Nuclear transport factor 2 family protein n=2 Tax=Sphingobium nicotianae TaxID=2782607 RepID=A0A9X1IQ84_9SPHN|nr:nuclear transport factor 2 family protein [Sphingobium nicotianae]